MKTRTLTFACVFIFLVPLLSAAQTLTGDWKGAISVRGTELTIITHFSISDSGLVGTIDIPQQGGQDIPLQKISVSPQDSVKFQFMAGIGLAKFKGLRDSNRIAGTFMQNGQSFPFKLREQETSNSVRPANGDTVTIENGDITLAGTLSLPENTPAPCAILLSGSGAQNRDEQIAGFKPFAQIANYLAQHGIATFRYDDRGIGKSTGNFSQTSRAEHLSDVRAIIQYLKTRKEINPSKIGLLGHSQGGIVATEFSAQNPEEISFVVLMASPAQTLAKTVIGQVKTILQEQGAADSLIKQQVTLQKAIFDTLRGSQNFESLKIEMEKQILAKIKKLPAGQRQSIQDPQVYAERQVQQQLHALQQPSYLSFLDYEPTQDLRKITDPVLALFGKKDTQVPLETNKSLMEEALKESGAEYKIKVFDQANHLFQKAKTGSYQEYTKLDNKFVDRFLPTLAEWITEQTTK